MSLCCTCGWFVSVFVGGIDMTKEEALKLALEALEGFYEYGYDRRECFEHITAIKEALAQPEQEPVARVIDNGTPEGATEWIPFTNRVEPLKTGDLLYTTPPQRPWVGLTNNELQPIADEYRILFGSWVEDFARAIEAKLKEKNT